MAPEADGVQPLLSPEGHRAPRNRTCRRPGALRARGSSSGHPAHGSGSKTHETSPAWVPPCCCLVSGRNLGTHFRPRSGTACPPVFPRALSGPRFRGGRGRGGGDPASAGPAPPPPHPHPSPSGPLSVVTLTLESRTVAQARPDGECKSLGISCWNRDLCLDDLHGRCGSNGNYAFFRRHSFLSRRNGSRIYNLNRDRRVHRYHRI